MARSEAEILKNWKVQEPPLVSVACVTYNHEPYIRDAIEGFLMQETDFPFEVIIGEDCSTDGTMKIVEEYKEKYPRIIKVLDATQNLGAAKNFFRTLYAAKGKFIAYCEGDDYWIDSSKLQQQVEFLFTHTEYSMSAHLVKVVDNTVKYRSYNPYDKFEKSVFTTEDILMKHFIPSLSWVFRADLIYFPEWYHSCWSGDIALGLIVSLAGPGKFFHTEMGVYNNHDNGISKSRSQQGIMQKSVFLLKSFDTFTNRKFSIFVKKRLAAINFSYALNCLLYFDFGEFAFHLFRAFRFSPHHFLFKLCIPFLTKKIKALKIIKFAEKNQ